MIRSAPEVSAASPMPCTSCWLRWARVAPLTENWFAICRPRRLTSVTISQRRRDNSSVG
jgi:hypothetical protein